MKLSYLLVSCASALVALATAPASAAVVSLTCTFSRSLVGPAYNTDFPGALNIWINTARSVADVQRYYQGYGWDPAPAQHAVRMSTGFYTIDTGNGGFVISLTINRMTGMGTYVNSVMFVPQNHEALTANYRCAKSNKRPPVAKF